MKKLIACCGFNCATCDARIATLVDSYQLREKTVEKFKVIFGQSDYIPEMINCHGCTQSGVKIKHCMDCQIRNCVISKNFKTCAECKEMTSCTLLMELQKSIPKALENFKYLK